MNFWEGELIKTMEAQPGHGGPPLQPWQEDTPGAPVSVGTPWSTGGPTALSAKPGGNWREENENGGVNEHFKLWRVQPDRGGPPLQSQQEGVRRASVPAGTPQGVYSAGGLAAHDALERGAPGGEGGRWECSNNTEGGRNKLFKLRKVQPDRGGPPLQPQQEEQRGALVTPGTPQGDHSVGGPVAPAAQGRDGRDEA